MNFHSANENRWGCIAGAMGKAQICIVMGFSDDLFERVGYQIVLSYDAQPKLFSLREILGN